MSKHREDKVINSVSCPDCGAGIGQKCHVNELSLRGNDSGRPMVHTSRRDLWRARRDRSSSEELAADELRRKWRKP